MYKDQYLIVYLSNLLYNVVIIIIYVLERFDEAVIEERRLAALELLNFLSSQPHLFNSLACQEFFEVHSSL